MKPRSKAETYFFAIENDLRSSNGMSQWLELFCQRAMTMKYSTRNVASILLQFPNATEVAGERDYNDNGAIVYPGATPIKIWAPKEAGETKKAKEFGYAVVFDVSQTTARPYLPRPMDEVTYRKKAYRLVQKAGYRAERTSQMPAGCPKIVERKNGEKVIYLQENLRPAIAGQLLCQELINRALIKEGNVEPTMAYALSNIGSYCVSIGCGISVPNLLPMDKLTACVGQGLLKNTEICVKMAKRVRSAIKKM